MRSRSLAAFVPLLMAFGVHADPVRVDADRYAHMHMLFEKTWFGIDVARVDVWFDPATRDVFHQLAAGQRYSEGLAERIARAAMTAPDVRVQVELLRDASLGEFLDAVRGNLEHARDAGYISGATFATAWPGVKTDFAALEQRGLKRGDRLIYRARADTLQTTVVSGDRVLLDVTHNDPGARPALIAGYFAPETDFRKGLIKSLF